MHGDLLDILRMDFERQRSESMRLVNISRSA